MTSGAGPGSQGQDLFPGPDGRRKKVKDDADRNTGPLGTGGAGLRFVSGRSAFRPENLRCPRVSRSTPRPPELRQTASGPEMVAVSRARRMTPAKVGPGRRPARSGCWSREPRVPGPVLRRRLLNERPLAAGQTWRRAALRLCLTSSRTGLTCSPVVAEGDAYPPYPQAARLPAVGSLSNQVIRGKAAEPHDHLNTTGCQLSPAKPARLRRRLAAAQIRGDGC